MGNTGSNKLNYHDVVQHLRTNKNTPKSYKDEFWRQFWPDYQSVDLNQLYTMINSADLRTLREETPHNFAQLVIYCSEQLIYCSSKTFCNTVTQQNVALNCCRLLIRVMPYVYEDEDFSKLLWSDLELDDDEENIQNNKEKLPKEPASPRNFKQRESNGLNDEDDDSDDEDDFENDREGNNQFISNDNYKKPLAIKLINAICDLLFCPEFTVIPTKLSKKGSKAKSSEPDTPPLELCEIDSCEFIWASGVGFTTNYNNSSSNLMNFGFTGSSYNIQHLERNRIDLLRLLLVLFSETMYKQPNQVVNQVNPYIQYFTSSKNRHCLPLFTSFLNTVLSYQLNSSYFNFYNNQQTIDKETLVELCLQLLIVCLDHDFISNSVNNQSDLDQQHQHQQQKHKKLSKLDSNENMSNDFCSNMIANYNMTSKDNIGFNADDSNPTSPANSETTNFFKNLENSTNASSCSTTNQQHLSYSNGLDPTMHENLFINYLARLHREEDFQFVLKGFVHLLNAPLVSTYLPSNNRRIQFHQELLILFWKCCDLNKKFLYFTLKSSKILEVLIPILYHLNEARGDQSKLGLIHIGIFIILLLSGERNFGVRLNKPFNNNQITFRNVPIFTGTHADLLIIVFHKLITTSSTKLQSLFECLLTIIVNVSPYLKTLTMVSANRLLHFFEAFSTPWFLYSNETNHHLCFYLLEIFNNIIQYQFDGNSNLIYTLLRKRHCFHQLANLPTDYYFICKSLNKPEKKMVKSQSMVDYEDLEYSMHNCDLLDNDKRLKRSGSIRLKNTSDKTNERMNKSVPATPVDKTQKSFAESLKEIDSRVEPESVKELADQSKTQDKTVTSINDDKLTETKIEEKNNDNQNKEEQNEKLNADKKKLKESKKEALNEQFKGWRPTPEWVASWKKKLPLQTIMRMLQVLIPQVEKMSLDKGITDENAILQFLEHGTLVGLLPVPHPILIRKYQTNSGTTLWFRQYMFGVVFLRNMQPPIWYDTDVKLFEIQKP